MMSYANFQLKYYIKLMISDHHENFKVLAHRLHCRSNSSISERVNRGRDKDLRALHRSAPYLLVSSMMKILRGNNLPFKIEIKRHRQNVHDRKSFLVYLDWVIAYYGRTPAELCRQMKWGRNHIFTVVRYGVRVSAIKMCKQLGKYLGFDPTAMILALSYAGMPLQTKRYRYFKLQSHDFPSQKQEVISKIHDRDSLMVGYNTLMYLNGYTPTDLAKEMGGNRFYITGTIRDCTPQFVRSAIKSVAPYLRLTSRETNDILARFGDDMPLRHHRLMNTHRRQLHRYLALLIHAHHQTFQGISKENGYRMAYLTNAIYQFETVDFAKLHQLIPYAPVADMRAVYKGDKSPYRKALYMIRSQIVDRHEYLFFVRSVVEFHGLQLQQVGKLLHKSSTYLTVTFRLASPSSVLRNSCKIAKILHIDPKVFTIPWKWVEKQPSYRQAVKAIAKANWMTLTALSTTVFRNPKHINMIMASNSLSSKYRVLRTLIRISDVHSEVAETVERRLSREIERK